MSFSLIIPCYNEAEGLPMLVQRCKEVIADERIDIVLVNNGSTDHSSEVLSKLVCNLPGITVVSVPKNKGYGYGILKGLEAAKGEYLGWTHADLQADPADALRGLSFLNANDSDLFVKGRRFGRPVSDTLFTIGMSLFECFLLRKKMWDINAQPNMFSRRFYEYWSESAPHDFSLDLYVYYKAKECGLNVKRFPVRFGHRVYGVSHWNIDWKSKLAFIKRTIRYSMQLRKDVKE